MNMKLRLFIVSVLALLLLATVPLVSAYGIVYYREAPLNGQVPQGGSGKIRIAVYNRAEDCYIRVLPDEIRVTTVYGERTPQEWWKFEVTPPLQSYDQDIGWKTVQVQANFFLPHADTVTEPPTAIPSGYDTWVMLKDNEFAFVRFVEITVSASKDTPRGEYMLIVPVSGTALSSIPGGMNVVVAYEARPLFYVTGPPPSPTFPVLVVVLITGALAAAVAVYVIYKRKKCRKK